MNNIGYAADMIGQYVTHRERAGTIYRIVDVWQQDDVLMVRLRPDRNAVEEYNKAPDFVTQATKCFRYWMPQ